MDDALVVAGDAKARSESPVLRAPGPAGAVDPKILDSYAGKYEIAPGPTVQIVRSGDRLTARVANQPPVELLPISDTEFYVAQGPVQIEFQRAGSDTVKSFKGWQNGQEFVAKRVE